MYICRIGANFCLFNWFYAMAEWWLGLVVTVLVRSSKYMSTSSPVNAESETDDRSQVCNQPIKPTQPRTLSGTGNEYRPKCCELCGCGVKAGMVHLCTWINVWVAGKTV